MIKDVIGKLASGGNLGFDEARSAAGDILSGEDVGDAEIAGLLVALKMKGETPEEIAGFAMGLRDMVVGIEPRAEYLVDTCGTGGDRRGTFNISTATAFVAAGAGASVAKHGNRGISSRCGSADVLEELGVDITLEPKRVCECIEKIGIGFMFAPTFHPAMKRVMGVRKALGVPTIFNLLGPLSNPALVGAQVLGVNRKELVEVFGEVLSRLGVERAFVIHGLDGMDEFTLTDESFICEVDGDSIESYVLSPEDLGVGRCDIEDLKGGDTGRNASILRDILSGVEGPKLDISLANAAFALVASGRVKDLSEGVKLARGAVESGEASKKLEELIAFSGNGGGRDVPR